MKKILSIVLSICVCLVVCACDEPSYTTNETIKESSSAEVSSVVEEGDIWTVRFYVDDFNQQTNEWFVVNKRMFDGQFSNSATTNSLLSVLVAIDGEKTQVDNSEATVVGLFLYEYGTSQVKNPYSEREGYEVQLRDDNGNEYSGYGTVPPKGDRLVLNARTADKLIQFMRNSEEVLVNIEAEEGMSSYLFSIITENFFDCYE